ncbi:hypothetical protein CBR_g48815 [Chara braunii]|uniref:HAT C-terminal dimerisation domain-containing protein n=1 Tax=Chara braunii TaxID=69332 RepID=A0A388M3F4_CHABU|nr:hypothetical protein CBR_g48815 [Chara braunii]|eukprot:GBG89104.1 hypothetical protein CBR_g48815 [Chara braunii]
MASISGTSSVVGKGKEKVKANDAAPPFEAQLEQRQKELERDNVVYRWIERGREAEPKGYDQYWVRCKLCMKTFTTSKTRAVEHFVRKGKAAKTCQYKSGEMLHLLALRGATIEGDTAKRMLHEYRVEKGIAEDTGMERTGNVDKSTEDNIEQHLQPSPTPGREVRTMEEENVCGLQEAEVGTPVPPSCVGSSSAAKSVKTTQTSIRRWTENTAQKKLDMQWGMALFRSRVPFNLVCVDETKALHNLYMELGKTKAKVDMPTFGTLRTVILDAVYEDVKTAELCEKEPMWDRFGVADSSLTQKTASQWWSSYGGKHPKLQKIATRVTTMWSTATPCKRNRSSLDLIHTKRRKNLSSASLAKLVYIHWNMQLQCIPKSLKDGFVDVWASFFDEAEAPSPNDDPILPGPLVQDEEELRRQSNLRKTPKGRIPVGGGLEDSDTESSNEEIIWSDKPRETRALLQRSAKGEDVVDLDYAESEEDDEDVDGDGDHEEEDAVYDPNFVDLPPTHHSDEENNAAFEDGSDLECWSVEQQSCALASTSRDNVDRAAAKAMANGRDRLLVQQRVREEEARREAAPFRSTARLPRQPPPVQDMLVDEQQ